MLNFVRTHKLAVGTGAVALTAGLAWLAFGFFGVHTLFVDDVVDESGPVFDAAPIEAVDANAPAEAPTTIAPATTAPAQPDATTAPDATAPADTVPATPPSTEPPAAPATTAPANEVIVEYAGDFVSEAHPTSGAASVLGNGTGQRFLRLENFATDNGPDLNVYLWDDETGDYIDLGDLKGNIGDQNYEIPVDADLDRFSRVSIWCVRFSSGFGSAELMAA